MAHSSLRAHIKLTRLCRALNVKQPLAVGLLQHLWWQAYETEAIGSDGVLGGWTVDDIASAASWDREGAPFVETLCNVGFLDQSGDGTFSIHDYARWAPDYVKRRWRRAADRSPTGHRPDVGRLPNPTQPNQTKPKSKGSTPSPGREVRAEFWTLAQSHFKSNVLDSADFQKAWIGWCEYRIGEGKRLTKPTVQRQIARLEKWGHNTAIASIEQSIEQGWVGLFELKENARAKSRIGRVEAAPGKYNHLS